MKTSKKANLSKSKTIEIVDFVKEAEIDSMYYSKPYFLEFEKNANKAYVLLRDALKKSKKVGIAKFVIHNREHVAVIKTYEDAIITMKCVIMRKLLFPKIWRSCT